MRKIREVLRLKFDGGQTNRRIARSCHISRPSVADYLLRFEEARLVWPAAAAQREKGSDPFIALKR